jgi:hypothetical protein
MFIIPFQKHILPNNVIINVSVLSIEEKIAEFTS